MGKKKFKRGRGGLIYVISEGGRGGGGNAIESVVSTTNQKNMGLISEDRSNKATLLLTIPRSDI